MPPLKLTIAGQYWDSQIYMGRLHLFGADGDIQTIDWDRLVESLRIAESLELALEYAFLRSDYLYGHELQRLLRDTEFKKVLSRKFTRLANKSLEITQKRLSSYEIGRQDNPCPFPHSDSEIYCGTMYVTGRSGVTAVNTRGRTKYPISTRTIKKWDAPVQSLSAAWSSLALAAGSEGLYEMRLNGNSYGYEPVDFDRTVPRIVSLEHCTDCNWTYHSIFGSSHSNGFLASFHKETHDGRTLRSLDCVSVLTAEDLWGEIGYAWGVQDKLCLATDKGIRVLKYQPWKAEQKEQIRSLGTVDTQPWEGEVLSASAAPFGVVIELDHALLVYPSSGGPITITGEPVNWRVFPRAKHYRNQLHVVWDDRLEIYSFNHDYLTDQEEKNLGISIFANNNWRPQKRYSYPDLLS